MKKLSLSTQEIVNAAFNAGKLHETAQAYMQRYGRFGGDKTVSDYDLAKSVVDNLTTSKKWLETVNADTKNIQVEINEWLEILSKEQVAHDAQIIPFDDEI
jgi:hypothetical protein